MEVLRTRTVKEGKFLKYREADFRTESGKTGIWEFCSRHENNSVRCDAVVIVASVLPLIGEPARLLVTKEFRVPINDYEYGFPAGLVDPGETPEDAARRELREETGYGIVRINRVSPCITSSGGLTDEAVSMVFCHAEPVGKPKLEGLEELTFDLLDLKQIAELVDSKGKVIAAKAWTVLYLFSELHRNQLLAPEVFRTTDPLLGLK